MSHFEELKDCFSQNCSTFLLEIRSLGPFWRVFVSIIIPFEIKFQQLAVQFRQ